MNNCLLTLLLVICSFSNVKSQQFYVKPFTRYDHAVTTQNAPQYFTLRLSTPSTSGSYFMNVLTQINKFSVADGLKYGICTGYQINDIIGVETGIDYFKTNKKVMADPILYGAIGLTSWKYQAIQASPVFTFRQNHKTTALVAKAGFIIGVAWLQNSVSVNKVLETYELNKNISLGYTLGLEYDIRLNQYLTFAIEAGLEHSSYTPKKARLTAIEGVNQYSLQDQPERLKEINYVNRIKDLQVVSDPYNNYTYDENKPELRLKQSLQLSSAYFGLGVKYNFYKK